MTDAELVRRARRGQLSAREQLVRRWSPRMLAVCRARVGCRDAAEDLTQETLLRGLAGLEKLSDPEKLGAWLRGIAVRVCLDWIRARTRRQVPFSSIGPSPSDDVEFGPRDEAPPLTEAIENQEQSQMLLAEIDALPTEIREPLLLFYYDEITYDQIAAILGVSRATVNARLARARSQLARRLAHLVR